MEKGAFVQLLIKLSNLMGQNPEFRISEKLKFVQQRLEMPNQLLIMGEFKAGKSTLINIILGEEVLKEGRTATTAVKTIIRYGPKRKLIKVMGNGKEISVPFNDLGRLTSELNAAGEKERKQIGAIIVELPNPLLQKIIFIDSPGLNSVHEHHTKQALDAIKLADSIFWIFKYNSVGRSSELVQLKKLKELGKKPFGIVNMLDQHDEDDASDYIQFEYKKLKPYLTGMIGVSALEAKEAKEENDEELWEISGFPELLKEIEKVSEDDKSKLSGAVPFLKEAMDEVYDRLQSFIERSSYSRIVQQLDSERKNLVYEAQQFRSFMEERENNLNKKVTELNELLYIKGDFARFAMRAKSAIPKLKPHVMQYLKDWITLNNRHRNLKSYINIFHTDLDKYMEYHAFYMKGWKKFKASKNDYAYFRETSRKLKENSRKLKQKNSLSK